VEARVLKRTFLAQENELVEERSFFSYMKFTSRHCLFRVENEQEKAK
jgi:3-phenylpropionate/cinnamic acid dioxygenase small subunit